MNNLINLNDLPVLSKSAINDIAEALCHAIEKEDPAIVLIKLKFVENVIKKVAESVVVKNILPTDFQNCKLSIFQKRDINCENDEVWRELDDKMSILKAEIKQREGFLASLKSPVEEYVNGEATGCIIAPAVITYKDVIKIEIK